MLLYFRTCTLLLFSLLTHTSFSYVEVFEKCNNTPSERYKEFKEIVDRHIYSGNQYFIDTIFSIHTNILNYENYQRTENERSGGFEVGNGGDAYISTRSGKRSFYLLDLDNIEVVDLIKAPYAIKKSTMEINQNNLNCLKIKKSLLELRLAFIAEKSPELAKLLLDEFNSTDWYILKDLEMVQLNDEGIVTFKDPMAHGLQQAAIRYHESVVISRSIYLTGLYSGGDVWEKIWPLSNNHKVALILHEVIQGVLNKAFFQILKRGPFVRDLTRSLMGDHEEVEDGCEKLDEYLVKLSISCDNTGEVND